MARIRYLKPEFFTDEDLAELSFETRIAFQGLWCHADRAGRLEDRPKFLKAMIFPYDNIDMEAQLNILCAKTKHNGSAFIQRYEIDSVKLIQILSWDRHQKPHHTEADSKLPPFNPPKEKIKGSKDKGKGHQASPELKNGEQTVKEPLKSTDVKTPYNSNYFNLFWEAYPRKQGKGKAWEEWMRISPKPDENVTNLMISQISRLKETDQWSKDGGQFIPFPSTWLHQRRWEDVPYTGDRPSGQRRIWEMTDEELNEMEKTEAENGCERKES